MKENTNLKKTLMKFFADFDMFAVPPTLRAKQQPQTSSMCSGITSFLLALFFSYVFIINVVGIMTYTKIDSIQTESRLGSNQVSAQNVFFAIRVGYLPLQISQKYFDIGYFVVMQDGTNTTFPLQQCQMQQWKKLTQNYMAIYEDFQLQQFLCPHSENVVNLKKIFYAPNSQYLSVYVRRCTSNPNKVCQTPANQQAYIQSLKSVEGAIFITVYFLDQGIRPSDKQAIHYFLNTDPQLSFTMKRGVIGTIQLGTFQVETDESVSPVQEIKIQNGNYVNTFRETSIQINTMTDNFALIYVTLNRKYVEVQRKVGKLDDMLSYAGGLFSIIVGFLSFFILSFNKYRYELLVAEGIFHEDQQGNRIRQNDFTFFKYIKYSAFDWIGTLLCIQLKWHDCALIDSTREEANKQMDVTRLFRKIQSLQFAVTHILSQSQRECLALLKPSSLGNIKRNRLVLQYYNVVIQNRSSLNFQEYRISNQILRFGLMLLKNQQNQKIIYHQKQNSTTNPNQIVNESLTQQNINIQQFQINYQDLHDIDYLISFVKKYFKHIAEEAENVELENQQQEIEVELADSFFNLNQEKRNQFIGKIPIKILYRLAKKYKLLKSSAKDQQNGKKKKRVALNIVEPSRVFDFNFEESL